MHRKRRCQRLRRFQKKSSLAKPMTYNYCHHIVRRRGHLCRCGWTHLTVGTNERAALSPESVMARSRGKAKMIKLCLAKDTGRDGVLIALTIFTDDWRNEYVHRPGPSDARGDWGRWLWLSSGKRGQFPVHWRLLMLAADLGASPRLNRAPSHVHRTLSGFSMSLNLEWHSTLHRACCLIAFDLWKVQGLGAGVDRRRNRLICGI